MACTSGAVPARSELICARIEWAAAPENSIPSTVMRATFRLQ